jgi:hypothetical protein
MKQPRSLPIPFLILIIAGVVSLYSIVASRVSGATVTQDNSLQMQTVEQERVAAIYFRVLSWVSGITAHKAGPSQLKPQPGGAPQTVHHQRQSEWRPSISFCAFHAAHDFALRKFHGHILN